TDRALAFRADWAAAGGNVSAASLAAMGDELGLDPRQREALRQLVNEQAKDEIRIRADIDTANVDLRAELEGAQPDAAKVGRLIDRISQLEAEARKGRVMTWLEGRKLLTAGQQARLGELRSTRRFARRHTFE